ncbi:MAG TPA: alpha/beta hydrolase fold domain-containing protein [Rhizomicrobium sp.]|jgi:acetyl esterase/lipase|nr:alpha/beta hydrolase fold domain-containing protein [Rhizomicrobium sp.]
MTKIATDPRLDPRIKMMLGAFELPAQGDIASYEDLVAEMNSDAARAMAAQVEAIFEGFDNEDVAPSKGLRVSEESLVSQPDGNTILLRFVRPDTDAVVPCVYYIHGGGMSTLSCFMGSYRAWARIIAARGVAVAMVEFRNSVVPSRVPQTGPFPAGLNDCVSGLKWLHSQAQRLKIDTKRVIVAGESGGGNLTLATGLSLKKSGELGLVKGLYALCPYIAGKWPLPQNPSSTENEGLLLNLHNNRGAMSYGIEEFKKKNPLAWPGFASVDDVKGFPPTVITVNECDPLRDEGIGFYRLLLSAGVAARCLQLMGTTHAVETMAAICPDITRAAAADIANFATN